MKKTDRSVVRNVAYIRNKVTNIERHNERKNQNYNNGDVQRKRSGLNIYFKKCEGGYLQTFDEMVASKIISTRGLEKDAKIIDEMVFDVNSEYFELHGGYEYAKQFFEEAYRMAVEEIGGEQYILSAVMHADERNKALSRKYGHDIYHYHLHVVYVPVVDKEIRWTKHCKDPALVGKVKKVVKQVSNSKKWKSHKITDKDGKEHIAYSYSLLQDHYFEHMQRAGFRDFERGERGSTIEHLDILDYKIQQDRKKLGALKNTIAQREETVSALDNTIGKKEEQILRLSEKAKKSEKKFLELEEKATVVKQEAVTFAKIDSMGEKHTILGDVAIGQAEWKQISELAKEGVASRSIIKSLKKQIVDLKHQILNLKKSLQVYEGQSITDTMRYYQAKQRAPVRMAEVIAEIMGKPPEQSKSQEKQNERICKKNMQER